MELISKEISEILDRVLCDHYADKERNIQARIASGGKCMDSAKYIREQSELMVDTAELMSNLIGTVEAKRELILEFMMNFFDIDGEAKWRGKGRTSLLAEMYLRMAINNRGVEIKVADHYPSKLRNNNLVRAIQDIFESNPPGSDYLIDNFEFTDDTIKLLGFKKRKTKKN